jgi:type I restriction enzyme S subunit
LSIDDVKGLKPYYTGLRNVVRSETFNSIKFPLPPLSEQEQIVSYLDDKTTKIDELIQKKLRKIDLLKEYRTSLINTVVTKGLNPDVPMKDSGIEWIGEIPSHWETSKYKTLGNRFTQNIDVSVFQNQEVIHYSIPNVQENGIGILESGEDIDSSKILLKGGELIISKLNPRKSCVSIVEPNNDFLIVGSGEFVTLVPDKGNIKFLFYFVKSQQFTEYLDSCVESVTRSHQRVNPYIIYSSLIPLPPLSEQEQIVSYLDEKTSQIDKTIDIEKKKIELLKEYRQSLISNVVIGKIKVSESV